MAAAAGQPAVQEPAYRPADPFFMLRKACAKPGDYISVLYDSIVSTATISVFLTGATPHSWSLRQSAFLNKRVSE